jgi:hypothetical protein
MDEQRRRKKGRRSKLETKFDVAKAVDLKMKGLPLIEISRLMNCAPNTITYYLNKLRGLIEDPQVVKAYEANQSNFLKSLEITLAKEMFSRKKLDSASLNNIAYSFQQVFNAGRLVSGQSTQNIQYADALKAREAHQVTLGEIEEIYKRRFEAEDPDYQGMGEGEAGPARG